MKQEKLCEAEDMMPEELGAENAIRIPTPPPITRETLGNIQMAAAERVSEAMKEWQEARRMPTGKANSRQIAGDHYKRMDIQPWDVIDYGPKQQAVGFYRYNALKYIMRAGEKGDFKEDIAKAQHYLEKLLEIL